MIADAQQQQQPQQQKRCPGYYTLQVADRLDKYIPLPPRPTFKVTDALQRGEVYSFIRSKSSFLLPDRISKVKSRWISVTTTGFMIIYENDNSGLAVDLRRVLDVFCHADRLNNKAKKLSYLRCHIKIRLPRGNIHLFVRDEDIHKWTCAIMRASAKTGKKVPRAMEKEEVLVTAVENVEEEEQMMVTPSSVMTASSSICETCKEEDDCAEGCEEEEWEEDEEMSTVVENLKPLPNNTNTTSSVRSLRLKLEKDLIIKPKEQVLAEQEQQLKKPLFVTELFCPPPVFNDDTIVLEPTSESERKEQEKEVERERKWWTRSLRC